MNRFFERVSGGVAMACGQPAAFILAFAIILVWALTGPIFHWSDTWQLVINTGTTIVTFLMVFLIQNAQNRDASAIQAKLDELIDLAPLREVLAEAGEKEWLADLDKEIQLLNEIRKREA